VGASSRSNRTGAKLADPTGVDVRTCSARPGGHVGFVGVGHEVTVPGMELFWSLVHLHGGPAPVRRFLPELIDLILNRQIDPGKVFDLELPLDDAAAGYAAMDERRAIKALLRP
jgi:threonine dehydrogenase-like Zn-dependent dehydrogenase